MRIGYLYYRVTMGYISCVSDILVGYVKMPGSVSSNILRNFVDTYRMYLSEVEISPVQAAMFGDGILLRASCKIAEASGFSA